MGKLETPRGFSSRQNRDGSWRYYWVPSPKLRKAGWKTVTLPRELGARARDEEPGTGALGEADAINARVDAWRRGEGPGPLDRRPNKAGKPALRTVQPGTIAHAIRLYTGTPEKPARRWQRLSDATRRDYRRYLNLIEAWAGDTPARQLTAPVVQDFYDALLEAGKHSKANAALRVLRLLLSDAKRRGLVTENVAREPGMIGTDPRLRIWTREEIAALVETADILNLPSIGDAVMLAAYIGQRQSDLLRLTWTQIEELDLDRQVVSLKQGKRGALVSIPLAPPLVGRLAAARARQQEWELPAKDLAPVLVCELTGRKWVADTFRHEFAQVRAYAALKIPSLLGTPPKNAKGTAAQQAPKKGEEKAAQPAPDRATFLDLRDAAVTRLAEAGCTVPEISSITGHSPASAHTILKHYLATTSEQAASAIAKLVAHEDRQATRQKAKKQSN